eukprot:6114746-Pleurochrysis_carterae.AAC.2
MKALRVAIQSNDENEFPMIHRLLQHWHPDMQKMSSCKQLASLLDVAAPYGMRLLSKTYLRPLTCDRFVEVIEFMHVDEHLLRLYHHSPDFVRRVHGKDDCIYQTQRSLVCMAFKHEDLKVIHAMHQFLVESDLSTRYHIWESSMEEAPPSVWKFLPTLDFKTNEHPSYFISRIAEALGYPAYEHQIDSKFDFIQEIMPAHMIEHIVANIIKTDDSSRIAICRWLTASKQRGYFPDKNHHFETLCVDVCKNGLHEAVPLLVHHYDLDANDVVRYDLLIECATNESFACFDTLMHELGLRQHLLQDATLFVRLLHASESAMRAYILQVYDSPFHIPTRCLWEFKRLDPESEQFLLDSQSVFRDDLMDRENAAAHDLLIRSLRTHVFSDDAIVILTHIFGEETMDAIINSDDDDFLHNNHSQMIDPMREDSMRRP